MVILSGGIFLSGTAIKAGELFVPADDSRLEYSDYAVLEFPADELAKERRIARMHRPLSSPGKGYQLDNPGARLRFNTDANKITVHLRYSDKHISTSARVSGGVFLIDGKSSKDWKFQSRQTKVKREVEQLDLKLPTVENGVMHCYEIIMPYGDSVDVAGITVNAGANFSAPPPRPTFRCICYGDSITQGFTAQDISGTYTFRLGQLKNWQVINMAIAGRAANPADGLAAGKIPCDILTVMIGVNDWQGGRDPEIYRKNITRFIANFRSLQPRTPIRIITPLWVPESWKPAKASIPLETYRQVLREVVNQLNDPQIKLIEGSPLIDHNPRYFDRVAVHPADSGFEMMAQRLAPQL
jgi:lysophospholipase L1-like esterase